MSWPALHVQSFPCSMGFMKGGLDSFKTSRVGKWVSGPSHTCDCTGVSLGPSVSLGYAGFLNLGMYPSGGRSL